MGDLIEVGAADGHRFKAYKADPAGDTKKVPGAVIIAPEIFGVNSHIRQVADNFAQAGYLTIAPQFFDRSERDYEAGYEQTDIAAGIAIIETISFDEVMRDLAACLPIAQEAGKVAIVGYCWGGTIAWLAAARQSGVSAAVAYYGGGIPDYSDEPPQCPVMLHFAELDKRPDRAQAQAIAAKYPDAESFFYPAGHGFNCDQRGSYDAAAASQALSRTHDFLARHLSA